MFKSFLGIQCAARVSIGRPNNVSKELCIARLTGMIRWNCLEAGTLLILEVCNKLA